MKPLTIWRVHIRHVRVVCLLACPQRDSGRAAERRCAVVALVQSAMVGEMFFDQWKIIQRLQVQVLVVGQDEHNVWLRPLWRGT